MKECSCNQMLNSKIAGSHQGQAAAATQHISAQEWVQSTVHEQRGRGVHHPPGDHRVQPGL